MISKTLAATAAMFAYTSASESELFLIDQALEEFEADLADTAPTKQVDGIPTETATGKTWDDINRGAGCSFTAHQTNQIFSFRLIDDAWKVTPTNPKSIALSYKSIGRFLWQGSICQALPYDLVDDQKAKTQPNRIHQSDKCKGKDHFRQAIGVLPSNASQGKHDAREYNCEYTFGDGGEYQATNLNAATGKYEGIRMSWKSEQHTCVKDDGSKDAFRFILDVTCGPDATKKVNATRLADGCTLK